jgi:hypothetical protein
MTTTSEPQRKWTLDEVLRTVDLHAEHYGQANVFGKMNIADASFPFLIRLASEVRTLRGVVTRQAVQVTDLQQQVEALTGVRDALQHAREGAQRASEGALSMEHHGTADLLRNLIERLGRIGVQEGSEDEMAGIIAGLWYLHHGAHQAGDMTEYKLQPEAPEGSDPAKLRRLDRTKPPFVRDEDGDAPGPEWFTGDWVERAYQIQESNGWLLPEGSRDEIFRR